MFGAYMTLNIWIQVNMDSWNFFPKLASNIYLKQSNSEAGGAND